MERKEASSRRGTPKEYHSNVCQKILPSSSQLAQHSKRHTGEKSFQCDYCHEKFPIKENLKAHLQSHTKEKLFCCEICGWCFEHSGKLTRHAKTHTGDKPHACPLCPKRFIQTGQLKIHMCIHSGEKPFRCPFGGCDRAFKCSKHLKAHRQSHSGDRPYTCDICSKDFTYRNVLSKHRRHHFSERCYRCKVCSQTFHSRKEMDAHIKKTHCIESSNSTKSNVVNINVLDRTMDEYKSSENDVYYNKKHTDLPVTKQTNIQVANGIKTGNNLTSTKCQVNDIEHCTEASTLNLSKLIGKTVERAIRKSDAHINNEEFIKSNLRENETRLAIETLPQQSEVIKDFNKRMSDKTSLINASERICKTVTILDNQIFNEHITNIPIQKKNPKSVEVLPMTIIKPEQSSNLTVLQPKTLSPSCLPPRKRKYVFQPDSVDQTIEQHTSVIQFAPAVQS